VLHDIAGIHTSFYDAIHAAIDHLPDRRAVPFEQTIDRVRIAPSDTIEQHERGLCHGRLGGRATGSGRTGRHGHADGNGRDGVKRTNLYPTNVSGMPVVRVVPRPPRLGPEKKRFGIPLFLPDTES
ncbi:MAG: hypothetical protein ACR2IT_08315, partial [Pirellulales bacterium]